MILASLQFEGVQNLWLWLVLIAVGGALMVWTYRDIYLRSQRPFTWWLFVLRMVGLLALLLALAKPTWTDEDEWVDPGRVAVVLDNSLSMSLDSRFQKAVAGLEKLRSEIESADSSRPRVELDVFDVTGQRVTDDIPKAPRVERTDLVRSVSAATAQLRSKPLSAVVLISDGIDNTGREDITELANSTFPIYGVGFPLDSQASPLDVELRTVRSLERVMVNNKTQVTITVAKTAGPAVKATVSVRRAVEPPVTSQTIELPEGSGQRQVNLTFEPTEAGSFVYTASVETDVGEQFLANNSRHFPLQVDADAIRVLYLEGFLRYEYKYLKNRLDNDPDIHLVTEVRRVNPGRPAASINRIEVTADLLKNIDLVILGDMEADYFTQPEYEALVNWVDQGPDDVDQGPDDEVERGHSLLVLGGYRSFGPTGFRTTRLAEVLPVIFSDSGRQQTEEPFSLALTELGKRHPIFQITADRVHDEAMWTSSPPLLGMSLVQRAKAAAEILAVNPNARSNQSDDQPAVLIVTGRYGSGQTMVISADTTWRWSRMTRLLGKTDTLYSRFWSQTVRWLTGRDLSQKRSQIVVSTDRPDYDVGKQVTIRVVRQADAETDGDITVEVVDETETSVPIQLQENSAEPNVLVGSYYPSVGGRYRVNARLTSDGQTIANQAAELMVHSSELELADTASNPTLLRSIANRSGGVYVDIDEIDKLASRIERKERRISRIQRSEFWDSPLLFLLFLAAVTGEWVLRRHHRLV